MIFYKDSKQSEKCINIKKDDIADAALGMLENMDKINKLKNQIIRELRFE
jgi:hypothetical protein